MNTPLEILKHYWNFDSFKTPQESIISSVLDKKDTIALLPTGGGKSICFQVPTLLNSGICVVISPLIALMNDQVKNLTKRGIKAIQISSKLNQDEIVTLFDNLQFGNYKFLYLSPEKLQSEFIQEKIKQLNVQLIAVDEAHCISEWGHDFRPAYLQINKLRLLHPDAPIIALTASATKEVVEDIKQQLELKEVNLIKKSFYRPNLAYQIFTAEDKMRKIEHILNKNKGSAIIYTNTRRKTIEISNELKQLNFNATFYHGGMTMDEKLQHYEDWLSEKTPIIVATNAFGMGIDKPNVRAVIHHNLPHTLENYMQEAGRGGRDGNKAISVVLKNSNDIYDAERVLQKTLPTKDYIKEVYTKLSQFFRVAYGELTEENYDFDLGEFCKIYKLPIVLTYNALKTLDRHSILLLDENFDRKSTVKFITSNHQVFEYCEVNSSKNALLKLLLRTYGGIFENPISINENYICNSLKISKNYLKKLLQDAHEDGIIQFYNANTNTQIRFLVPREDGITINLIGKNIEQQNKQKIKKAKDLLEFVENNKTCRSIQLLSYFGETKTEKCGMCDVCISKNEQNAKLNITDTIIELLKTSKELSSSDIANSLEASEKEILFSLQLLLEKNILSVTSRNKYKLN